MNRIDKYCIAFFLFFRTFLKTNLCLDLNASTFYLKRNYVLLQTQGRSIQNARAFSEAFRREEGNLDGLSGLAGIFINCIYAGCGNKSVVLVSTPVYRKLEKPVTTRQPVKRGPGKARFLLPFCVFRTRILDVLG